MKRHTIIYRMIMRFALYFGDFKHFHCIVQIYIFRSFLQLLCSSVFLLVAVYVCLSSAYANDDDFHFFRAVSYFTHVSSCLALYRTYIHNMCLVCLLSIFCTFSFIYFFKEFHCYTEFGKRDAHSL